MHTLLIALFLAGNEQLYRLNEYIAITIVIMKTASKAKTLASLFGDRLCLPPLHFCTYSFVFSSVMNGNISETFLLQYIRLSFSTSNAWFKYARGICMSYLSVVRLPLIVVCDKQEAFCLTVFINKHLYSSRKVTVLSMSTTYHVIPSVTTSLSSNLFSSFSFAML